MQKPSVSASKGLTEDPMDVEVQGTETLHDIEMQEDNDSGDIKLDDVGTGLESTIEKNLAQEEVVQEDPTLHLNIQIEELKQCIYGLEVLNQALKVQGTVQKQKNIELEREVKEQKLQVNIWKFRASKCYGHLRKVTKHLKKAQSKKRKIVKAGISIQNKIERRLPHFGFFSR